MSKLRRLRKASKLTIEAVAESVDSDVGNLSRIERGLQVPGYPLAKRLSAFYSNEITVDELAGKTEVAA